jgi:hypothetical protein
MAHYPHLDVVPIYQSFGGVTSVVAGIVFFDEGRFYDFRSMVLLMVFGALIITGISFIAFKNSTI